MTLLPFWLRALYKYLTYYTSLLWQLQYGIYAYLSMLWTSLERTGNPYGKLHIGNFLQNNKVCRISLAAVGNKHACCSHLGFNRIPDRGEPDRGETFAEIYKLGQIIRIQTKKKTG